MRPLSDSNLNYRIRKSEKHKHNYLKGWRVLKFYACQYRVTGGAKMTKRHILLYGHSGLTRARSEALALSSFFQIVMLLDAGSRPA